MGKQLREEKVGRTDRRGRRMRRIQRNGRKKEGWNEKDRRKRIAEIVVVWPSPLGK
jgi:hypothetical protein